MSEEELIRYIKSKCKPKVILLHGSRASGKNRIDSDWDVIVFSNKGQSIKDKSKGNYFDVSVEPTPKSLKKYAEEYGYVLYKARILLDDRNRTGKRLVELSKKIEKKGKKLTKIKKNNRKLYHERLLARLEGTKQKPEQFFLHLGYFYESALNIWFRVRGKYSKPVYEALEEIQKKDKSYYNFLKVISSNASNDKKITAAKAINKKLFS